MSKDFQKTMYICKKCYRRSHTPHGGDYILDGRIPCDRCGNKAPLDERIKLTFSPMRGWVESKSKKRELKEVK